MAQRGIVYLVGAGPGDPGLMTRRSLELIAAADAILYDRLIPATALEGARADCELRYVGKAPGDAAMSQERIGELLVELGRSGKQVVRLKGGDPFVFGRGGEEAAALAAAGVPFEVVPGVTAGVAAPAYAGIPVTNRGAAAAVAFVTGHEAPGKEASDIDWDGLARFPGTLVFYMGVRNLPLIADALIAAGRDPAEPAAVIRNGTLPDQRTVTAPLADVAECVAEAGLTAPAITVVGPAVGLRDTLAWLERRPLHGQRVAVTRARAQASGLATKLRELGADVVETPTIRIEPRPVEGEVLAAVDVLGGSGGPAGDPGYSLVCFTSTNGVRLFLSALATRGLDALALAAPTIAAIGPGTAAELARQGVQADVVPERSVAESLVEALAEVPVEGRRVLVARGGAGRDVVPDALRGRGAEVDTIALYDTLVEPLSQDQRAALANVDFVTLTSASSVRNLLTSLGDAGATQLGHARLASIGPITSDAARALGLTVDVEAKSHDVDGLVEALVADSIERAGQSADAP
jgi:uroporphyrinogen III methyltransferase / synthase